MKYIVIALALLVPGYFLTVHPGRVGIGLEPFYLENTGRVQWPASLALSSQEYNRYWYYSTIRQNLLYKPDSGPEKPIRLQADIMLYHGPMLYGKYGGLGRGKFDVKITAYAPHDPQLESCLNGQEWLMLGGKVHFTGFTEIDMERRALDCPASGSRVHLEPVTARLVLTHDDYRFSGAVNGSEVIQEGTGEIRIPDL